MSTDKIIRGAIDMCRVRSVMFLSFLLLFVCGCVQMRDYTGVREGAFGLNVECGLGQGIEKKDYYLIGEGRGLIIGDTTREVISKIGLPDKVETTQEGYEAWVYEDRGIRFLFEEEKLSDWQDI